MSSKYGLHIEGGSLPHAVIAIVRCHTGSCGESTCYAHVIPANESIDAFAHEQAVENAQSYGSEGRDVCPGCGDDTPEGECEDCGEEGVWEPNDSIEGTPYKYQPSKSGIYVNGGDPFKEVFGWCIEQGAVKLEGDRAVINIQMLNQLLYIPDRFELLYIESEVILTYPDVKTIEYI